MLTKVSDKILSTEESKSKENNRCCHCRRQGKIHAIEILEEKEEGKPAIQYNFHFCTDCFPLIYIPNVPIMVTCAWCSTTWNARRTYNCPGCGKNSCVHPSFKTEDEIHKESVSIQECYMSQDYISAIRSQRDSYYSRVLDLENWNWRNERETALNEVAKLQIKTSNLESEKTRLEKEVEYYKNELASEIEEVVPVGELIEEEMPQVTVDILQHKTSKTIEYDQNGHPPIRIAERSLPIEEKKPGLVSRIIHSILP